MAGAEFAVDFVGMCSGKLLSMGGGTVSSATVLAKAEDQRLIQCNHR